MSTRHSTRHGKRPADDEVLRPFDADAGTELCMLLPGCWQHSVGTITALAEKRCTPASEPGPSLSIVTDPPYSARTHKGRRTGTETRKSSIGYAPLTRGQAHAAAEFMASLNPRTVLVFGDDETAPWWKEALEEAGLYVFRPGVFWVKDDPAPRTSGEGPTASVEQVVVARALGAWSTELGSLPGHYVTPTNSTRTGSESIPGEKPLNIMEALLRDYTRAGDLVVDLYAGRATTLEACRRLGRSSLGVEMDPATFALARKRLGRPFQPDMFAQQATVIAAANDDEDAAPAVQMEVPHAV